MRELARNINAEMGYGALRWRPPRARGSRRRHHIFRRGRGRDAARRPHRIRRHRAHDTFFGPRLSDGQCPGRHLIVADGAPHVVADAAAAQHINAPVQGGSCASTLFQLRDAASSDHPRRRGQEAKRDRRCRRRGTILGAAPAYDAADCAAERLAAAAECGGGGRGRAAAGDRLVRRRRTRARRPRMLATALVEAHSAGAVAPLDAGPKPERHSPTPPVARRPNKPNRFRCSPLRAAAARHRRSPSAAAARRRRRRVVVAHDVHATCRAPPPMAGSPSRRNG